MTDPRRLLEDDGDPADLALLRAARGYRPPRRLRKDVLVALGASGVLGASKLAVAMAAVTGALGGKALVTIGVVTALAAGGGTALQLSRRPARPPVVATPAADQVVSARPEIPTVPSLPAAEGVGGSPAENPPSRSEVPPPKRPMLRRARPVAAPPAVAPVATNPVSVPMSPPPVSPTSPALPVGARSPAANSAAAASTPSIAAELALLDGARGAIRAHDPARALALLDQHDRRFPRGDLRPEAGVLRLEALLAAGRRDDAGVHGRRFLIDHPHNVLAQRVRALLETLR